MALPPAARVLHDEAAYAHLLEVICGLHSPMVGETEVLHQFKAFTSGLAPEEGSWREIAQLLLADARAVRARHLVGLGSRSYGSAMRRYVGEIPRVAIAGTGMLAREILPFLVRNDRLIDQWGRRESIGGHAGGVTYRQLAAPTPPIDDTAALIIAAPLASADIARLAVRYRRLALLIDLRAEGVQDPPPPVAPLVTLADVFAGVEAARRATAVRVSAAQAEIHRRAQAFASRAKVNPSGWHDLCA